MDGEIRERELKRLLTELFAVVDARERVEIGDENGGVVAAGQAVERQNGSNEVAQMHRRAGRLYAGNDFFHI